MKTYSFEFQDSGVKLEITKVSPFLASDMRRVLDITKPKPPQEEITTAGPYQGTFQENENDPDYIEALSDHNEHVGTLINEFYIERGVVEIKVDDWQEQVSNLRLAFMGVSEAEAFPQSDKLVYISRIAAGTREDLQDLYDAIMLRSEPTQGAIDSHLNTFQPNL